MSPDWIKFDTQLIISVQLLKRKRKVEKFSCVFKKKKKKKQSTKRLWQDTKQQQQQQILLKIGK